VRRGHSGLSPLLFLIALTATERALADHWLTREDAAAIENEAQTAAAELN